MQLANIFKAFLLLCATTTTVANPAPPKPVPAPGFKKPCPEEFALYLGRGNDVQNRTWWFRGFVEDGLAMRLSAIPESTSTFKIINNRLVYAANTTLKANTNKDDETTFITMVSDDMKKTREGGDQLRPYHASIDKSTCELNLKFKTRKVYQRYGFYLHYTPEAADGMYTGQIQWFNKPIAVPPPSSDDDEVSFSVQSTDPKPENYYYLEDASGNYIGPK